MQYFIIWKYKGDVHIKLFISDAERNAFAITMNEIGLKQIMDTDKKIYDDEYYVMNMGLNK